MNARRACAGRRHVEGEDLFRCASQPLAVRHRRLVDQYLRKATSAHAVTNERLQAIENKLNSSKTSSIDGLKNVQASVRHGKFSMLPQPWCPS
jgi:hypothetical protein